VVNYDLPEVPDNYVHRIGRTARAGREGEAIAFCAPEEVGLLRQIQKLMKIDIPVASGKAPAFAAAEAKGPAKPRRRGGAPAKPKAAGADPAKRRRRRPRRQAA